MSWVLDQQDLHITIGAAPQTTQGDQTSKIDLKNDLAMVKAALLYADRAKLCSPVSSALLDILNWVDVPQDKRLDLIKRLRSWNFDEATQQNIEKIIGFHENAKRRRYSKKGRILLRQFDEALEQSWPRLLEHTNSFISGVGADGIAQAVESGLLDLYAFEPVFERIMRGDDLEETFWEYINAVSAAVTDAHTYPLFDKSTSSMISAGIAAGKISITDSGVNRSKEIGLAADFFNRLPVFPDATVKEILDIRRELDKPLRRFRGAIIAFSEDIKNAAWDKDFSIDAEQVFARDVAPAILNLEEEAKSNSFLATLASQVAERSLQLGGVVTGSLALSGLAVRMSNVPLVDVAALSIGPILAAAGIAYSAYDKWKSQEQSAEQNSLFFYYQAGHLLEQGKYQYVSDGP